MWPLTSRIGQTSRPRNRSYRPRWLCPAHPEVTRSSSLNPLARNWRSSASPVFGANPTPKRAASSRLKPGRPGTAGPSRPARRLELAGVELLRHLVHLQEPLALTGVARRALGGATAVVDVPQLDAGALGQALDGVGETEAVDLHDELDGVAGLPAPKHRQRPSRAGR